MLIDKNLSFRAAAEIASLLIGAVSMIYVSRVVGPEYLGFSATTSAVLAFASRLADGGLSSLAAQRLARDDESVGALLAITMPFKVLASAFLVALSLLLSNLLTIDPRLKYFITISVFIIFFEACTPAWIFVALGKIKIASVIRIGQSLAFAVAIFLFIHEADDWEYLPYLMLFSSFANFAFAVYFLFHSKLYSLDTSLFKNDYGKKLRSFYCEALHFLKAELSVQVYTSSDRLILYFFTNPYTVGIYEAAYKVISPFYAISNVITPTMFRELAQSFKQGKLYPVMSRYVFAMSLGTIPLGFFLLFFSKKVIYILYGPLFEPSTECLMILGFVITFGFTAGIIVLPFSAWNMSKEYGNSVFGGNVVNILLNFALIPHLGGVGAALSALAAKITVNVVSYNYFKKATDYPIIKDFTYFFTTSAIALALVIMLAFATQKSYLLMTMYLLSYFSLLFLLYKKQRIGPLSKQTA